MSDQNGGDANNLSAHSAESEEEDLGISYHIDEIDLFDDEVSLTCKNLQK